MLTFEERFPNLQFKPSDITDFSSNQANRAIYVIHHKTVKAFQSGQWNSINFEGKIYDVLNALNHYAFCMFVYDAKPNFNSKIGIMDSANQWTPIEKTSLEPFYASKYPESNFFKMYWVRGSKYIEKSYKINIGKITSIALRKNEPL